MCGAFFGQNRAPGNVGNVNKNCYLIMWSSDSGGQLSVHVVVLSSYGLFFKQKVKTKLTKKGALWLWVNGYHASPKQFALLNVNSSWGV